MNKKDALGFLGLCRRAGKLACGHDAVKETIQNNTSCLVIVAGDGSQRLFSEMTKRCEEKNIPIIRTSCIMADFAASLGKSSAVYSVTDSGFANRIIEKFKLIDKFEEELDGTEN
ncbi:MAG: ribosomal L7Ae/L30e/S12e/Gadd45 family protein [Oscillospiraceae bacterium]|nr:ribosomal L7Ae/L30e/S12e/Gadd45 family protein [Oscillospiraceae bacterium]